MTRSPCKSTLDIHDERVPLGGLFPAGTVIAGRYEIGASLGAGASGRVYVARDLCKPDGPALAIKQLAAPERGTRARARAWRVFERRYQQRTDLAHPAFPHVHAFFAGADGPFYMVRDLVPGLTMRQILCSRGALDWRLVAEWGIAISCALDVLHTYTPSLVFCDMKPANVVIDRESNQPTLIDFDSVRRYRPSGTSHAPSRERDLALSEGSPPSTDPTTIEGTPGYAPPEQCRGRPEPCSDVYALAVTLRALVIGREPSGSTDDAFSFVRLNDPDEDIPPLFARVLDGALASDPRRRTQSAREFGMSLGDALLTQVTHALAPLHD